MINSKLFIIPIVLLQFTQGLAQTNVSTSNSSAEQQQLLAEACNNLLKKNDAYVTEKRDQIFIKEFDDFNSTIDSLEQSVIQLVNKYKLRTEIDAQLIDSLLTETKFKHRRYRLLYPNNYHRFADLKKKATVPDDYFENVMKGSFDNPSLIQFKEYKRCVNFYLDILSAGEYKFSHLEYVPLKRMDNPVLTSEELKKLYLETPKMISFFEEKTGIAYPQKTYTQVLMGNYYQEMSGFAVFNEKYAESVFNDSSEIHLTGHELAHQWWGNMITCKNLKHFWLNEAFAVYMASAFHEVHFGPKKYEADIAIYKSIYDGLVNRGLDRSLIFEKWKATRDNRGIAYYKGAYVLHLLRQELGEEAFWKGVKEYSQKYYGKFVETKDFQESMEQASGRDLDEFFNEWVYN